MLQNSRWLAGGALDDFGWFIAVPRTARVWASGARDDLDTVLRDELEQQTDSLTDGCCESGGWPDDAEVEVTELKVRGNELVAEIALRFNEMVASACRDVSFAEKRHRWLTLRLARDSNGAEIEPSESDSQRWDIADRNSASDGE